MGIFFVSEYNIIVVYSSHHYLQDKNVCFDWVEIDDGNSTQRYCGTSIPGPFTSTGTNMTVKFRSDEGRTNTGFLAVVCCSVNVTTDVNTGKFNMMKKMN